MKNILLASDLSEHSEQALRRAALMAAQLKARLHVLHVLDDRYQHGLTTTIQELAEAELKKVMSKVLQSKEIQDTKVLLISGDPYMEIIKHANKLKAFCTIIGMHRKQSLELFVGTTADRVSRYNKGLTLLARNQTIKPYRHVLCATDFSLASRWVLQAFDKFAPQADLLLAHFPNLARAPFLSKHETKSYEQTIDAEVLRQLQAEAQDSLPKNRLAKIKYIVQDDDPLEGVLKLVEQHDIDLIMLGKHDRSAISLMFASSLTRAILSKPPCDVLLAKV